MFRCSHGWKIPILCLALCACTSERVELLVDLRTDFVAGDEFVTVNSALRRLPDGASQSEGRSVAVGDRVVDGLRIAEFADLRTGRYELWVDLRAANGMLLVRRPVELELRESFAVTVLITRNCRDVTCDEPERSACLEGMCVDRRCTPQTPANCPMPSCEMASDCESAPSAACAVALCADGACLLAARTPPRCAADLYCDPELGCRASPARDAGARDAGMGDSGMRDADIIDSDAGGRDAGTVDSGMRDAGTGDGGSLDGGSPIADAGPPSTCWNDMLDGDETQTDCGGSCSTSCSSLSDCAAQTDIPVSECWALVALYESTNGSGWTTSTNWLGATPCNWHGVTCGTGHVTEIQLSFNALSGTIPPELGNLPSLTWLELFDNDLSGTIPPELGNLTNLTDLHLSGNVLSGGIPPELGNLTSVTYFDLRNNLLSGVVPPALMAIPGTRWFLLRGNGCLTATGATFLAWLRRKDPQWNNGC